MADGAGVGPYARPDPAEVRGGCRRRGLASAAARCRAAASRRPCADRRALARRPRGTSRAPTPASGSTRRSSTTWSAWPASWPCSRTTSWACASIRGAETWLHALESLQRVSREIRDTTLDLRMVPVDELFSRFPRVVRDLADRSGKEIELRIVGQDTRLDRTIVERLSDPMVHLIRNAVDHALEHPHERVEKGKPRVGRITLSAGHEGDRVAIRVEDDGRGLDREKIVKKGIALKMIAPGTAAEDPRVVSLIFEPGFSTRDTVSELSGRGVGLDVVRDAVRALRGTVAVESTPGKGTAFIFRLPLTLALIDGLLVETAGGKYVVPLAQVEECVALNGTRSALADDRPCIAVRGELVPMVSLRNLFRTDGPLPARQELLLTRHAGQRVGVAVDRLLGRVQAVIQSLGDGTARLQPILRGHDPGRWLRLPDP